MKARNEIVKIAYILQITSAKTCKSLSPK